MGSHAVVLAGYTGAKCETEVDECDSNPCENGGSCTDDVNSFTCDCITGFTGTECEVNIDNCENDPCENSGVCM